MAGKLCNGVSTYSAVKARNSVAYCEGAYARTQSTTPTNPHESGSEAYAAFAQGVSDKAGGTVAACCAPMGAAAV